MERAQRHPVQHQWRQAGDGWTGQMPASGIQSVIETSSTFVTYVLNCTYPDSDIQCHALLHHRRRIITE